MAKKDVKIVRNYINGKWVAVKGVETLDVHNPSTGEVIAKTPLSTISMTNEAIEAAAKAFPKWSATPVSKRADYIFHLAQLLRENEDRICRVLVEEMGKSLPDAHAEMKRAIENCEVACGIPMLQQGDKLIGISDGIDGEVIRVPVGVFTAIMPFNFPAMVPFWFLPFAIATGNTFILKPSERVPLTMELITEYIDKTGLPAGVFNLVNGNKTVSNAFMESPHVKGISIVGSTRVCKIVAEKCAQTGKRCQAMGSAKNHLVVMPDAKLDEVVRNMVTSCYGCAGQRCMASSAIVCVGDDTYKEVCDKFIAASKGVVVADPLDPKYADEKVLMGPVISLEAKERILGLIEDGIKEGATIALDGRNLIIKGREKGYYIGPTVFTDVKPGMKIHKTEIFGPVVVILKCENFEEAIKIVNSLEYGNGASIYTQSGYYARRFKLEAEAGMIGINIGIPAPAAYMPFGGMKDSLFADIKAQGKSIVRFYTDEKIVTERFWEE